MPISPKLPLGRSSTYGYAMNETIRATVEQNLINLLLTVPGERIMDPDFGVGLKKYLFEQGSALVSTHIEGKIREQVKIYMGFLNIANVQLRESEDIPNLVNITIDYAIGSLNLADQLSLEITT
jgi:phage baseplate assembly protein W